MTGSHPGLRVLHVIPEDGLGGVEVAAKSVLRRSDLPCHLSVLFILQDRGAARQGWADRLGFLSFRNLTAYRRAFSTMRRSGTEVIIFSLWKSVPLLILAKILLRRRKLVFFLHLESSLHRVEEWLSRIAMRLADAVWADSEATLLARRVPPDKRTRVISFVTERLAPQANSLPAPSFLFWGRLNRQKGVDRAIELVALLARRGLNPTLRAYGRDDGEQNDLAALADRLGIADRVAFPGPIAPDSRAAVAANGAFFLQLSRSEGMCMAAVEAMQLGLVLVATLVGQMASYVRPGATGIPVDPDDLGAAADEIAALLTDRRRYAALVEGARAYWADAPLYADDICRAAIELSGNADDPRQAGKGGRERMVSLE